MKENLEVCESRMIGRIDVEEITVRPKDEFRVVAKLWSRKESSRYTLTQEQASQYANLFAASPDLMKALEGMCKYWEWVLKDPQFEEYRRAKEAIAKARGL